MRKVVIFLIKLYKKYVSKMFQFFGFDCKFYPTCSDYTMQAVEKYGTIKGIFLGIKRILKCNPFSKGGYDPLK